MPRILAATDSGCRVFAESGECAPELADRSVTALTRLPGGECLAVIDASQVFKRARNGLWIHLANAPIQVQSLTQANGTVYCGGLDDAVLWRVPEGGKPEPVPGFDRTPGRADWFGNGPPLGVRSMVATLDGSAILAAVHVGGIPRSEDGGATWTPTLPILHDVHELAIHPTDPNLVAAATAVGLCVSRDAGRSWRVITEGLWLTNSLTLAFLEDEALFGICDGPFAKQSQIWRWRIGDDRVSQVRNGLPESLTGKVDTAQLAAAEGRAAFADGAGNLWLSAESSRGWSIVASDLVYPAGLTIV